MNISLRHINTETKYLLLIALCGVVLKFWSIGHGLPSVYNSTEYFLAKHALSFGARKSLEPLFFIYPTLYVYLLAALFGVYFAVGKIIGIFPSAAAFGFQFIADPTAFYLLGRSVSALAIILSAALIFKTARYYLNAKNSFLIGLLFLSGANVHFFAKWMTPDALLMLGTCFVLRLMVKQAATGLSAREIIAGGLITGLTISLKYNAGFLALGWLFAIAPKNQKILEKKALFELLRGVGLILAGFLAGTPYWLLSFSKFKNGFLTIWSQSKYAYNFETGPPYIWEIFELIRSEWLLGALLIIAIALAVAKWRRETLPMLLVILPTFLLVGSWSKKGLDYSLIIFPAAFILLAFIYGKFAVGGREKWLRGALILTLIFSVGKAGYANFRHSFPDTRGQASEWLIKNLNSGDKICYAHYHYDIDLIDAERYLSYGEGSKFLSPEIREKLTALKKSPRNVPFVSFQKKIELSELPENLRRISQNDPFLREVFLNPHRSLAELRNEGVAYLILNSDTYLKFLVNPAPEIGHPLRADFVFRRDFYKNILDHFQPLRIFKGDWRHDGPILRVYKLSEL